MKHIVRSLIFSLSVSLSCGCSDANTPADEDAGRLDMGIDAAKELECLDLERLQTCTGQTCTEQNCRGDQVCQDSACIAWETADFAVDFALTVDSEDPLKIAVLVDDGGFPRAHVDALRFDFGDGIAGWGEELGHTYSAGGVYRITLVVRLEGYRELEVSKLAVVNPPSDYNPLRLTINQIPSYLNGNEPAVLGDPADNNTQNFTLQVPNNRFDINLGVFEQPGSPIDRSTLRLTATVDGSTTDLTSAVVFGSPLNGMAEITRDVPLPIGMVELELSASTTDGVVHNRTLTVETVPMTAATDPFDRPMVWLLRDDTDFFATVRTEAPANRYRLESTPGANGLPDFVEELALMGAQGPDEAINTAYLGWIREAITAESYRVFGMGPDGTPHDGIEFKIVWIGDAEAPSPDQFSPTGDFSIMRLGGVFQGYLGFSPYEVHNALRVDNSLVEFGVASAGILGGLTSTVGISAAFNPINSQTGFIVGEHPSDAAVFANDFDPYSSDEEAVSRYFELKAIAQNIAYAVAPVLTHEMGHAMGLMPNGLPPEGFFGGRSDVHFVNSRTNSHHADLPGLNLMQAGGDTFGLLIELDKAVERDPRLGLVEIAKILSLETRLSPLSRAYLQRKLTYSATPLQ